jgi:uncharacterized iron-regulated membrane protein
MSIDILIGIAGVLVTVLVVAGMILITPRGAVPDRTDNEPQRRNAPPAAPVERAVRRSIDPSSRLLPADEQSRG